MNYLVALVTATTCVACLSSPTPLEEETRPDTTSEVEAPDLVDTVETVDDADVTGAETVPEVETTTDTTIETEAIEEAETAPEVETSQEVETTPDAEVETTPDAEVETTSDAEVETEASEEAETVAEVEVDIETTPDVETIEEVETHAPLALSLAQSEDTWSIENERLDVVLEGRSGWLPAQLATGPSAPNLVHGERIGNLGQTNEEWVGLILFDLAHLWRHDVTPEVDERGPAVVRMWKTWRFDSTNGTGTFMSGRTDMTVHADGRVVLSYDVSVPSQRVGTLVAYVALDIERFTNVTFGDGTAFPLPSGEPEIGDGYVNLGGFTRQDVNYLCAWANNATNRHAVGFVAKRAGDNLLLPRLTEHSFVRDEPDAPPHSVRLQYDLARSSVGAGFYAGRFLLVIDDSRDCTHVATLAAAFRTPPSLTFSVGNLELDEAGDHDGDGYNDVTGAYSVSTSTRALAFRAVGAVPSATLRVSASTWLSQSVVETSGFAQVLGQPARAARIAAWASARLFVSTRPAW